MSKNIIPPLTKDASMSLKAKELAQYIDHTMLKADAPKATIEKLCDEAVEYGFCSVCVNSYWIPLVAKKLKGSSVKVCTVVGFPLGAMSSASKAFEAKEAVENGADEVDMVINVGEMKSKDYDNVLADIKAVRAAVPADKVLKVIIETCLLTDEEKVKACQLSVEAGADFVKTSTGFSTGGATVADIELMRKTVGSSVGVKASGGIRTAEDSRNMLAAGATRIGCGKGVAVVTDES